MHKNSRRYHSMCWSSSFTAESRFHLSWPQLECSHRKRYSPDTDGKHNETVKCDYGRQLSRLHEVGPSDVVCQVDGSPSPQQRCLQPLRWTERVSGRVPSFSMELADSQLPATKKGDGPVLLQLTDLRADTSFVLNVCKRYITCLAYCKDVSTRNAREQWRSMEFIETW